MVLLENESFLSELTKLYQKVKTTGTVQVTMKRYDGRTKPVSAKVRKGQAEPIEPSEYMCLLRATCGSRKVSTVVAGKDMNKFQLAYSNLVRGNIELKRKEKKGDAKGTTVASGAKSSTSKPKSTAGKKAPTKKASGATPVSFKKDSKKDSHSKATQ
jgi:signal recognition particle subunit SRP14